MRKDPGWLFLRSTKTYARFADELVDSFVFAISKCDITDSYRKLVYNFIK